MKIVYEIEKLSVFGGMQRIMVEKANELAEHFGHEVALVVLFQEPEEPAYAISGKVKIYRLRLTRWERWQVLFALNRLIKRLAPDVLVTCHVFGALACKLKMHRAKMVYESHVPRQYMNHQWALSVAEKNADCIVTLTQGDALNYQAAKRVEVLPNFTEITSSSAPDYAAKHCITVGRLSFEKDYPRMFRLWKKVCNEVPGWTLDIFGDGPDKAALETLTDQLQLQGHICFHGTRSQIAEEYAKGSLYLSTARFEGFGLSMVEAMACGLPVVAFDCPFGPREIVQNGKTGFLVPINNDALMVETLKQMLSDERLRQTLGSAAWTQAAQFQKEPIMSRWQAILESLV